MEAQHVRRRKITYVTIKSMYMYIPRQENIDQPIQITPNFCRADLISVLLVIQEKSSIRIYFQFVQLM